MLISHLRQLKKVKRHETLMFMGFLPLVLLDNLLYVIPILKFF